MPPSASFRLLPAFPGFLFLIAGLPACRQARQVGESISSGTSYVTQPVVTGSKKLVQATKSGGQAFADATVSGSRAVADATVSGSRKIASATVSGAKSLARGATRLVTFGSANREPAPVPLAPATGNGPDAGLPPVHQFPSSGLLVRESELGPEATRLEATAVNLGGGWVLNGSSVAYRLPPGADDPTALLVKGSPAIAILGEGEAATTASADELHYHSANQVLTLKGNAVLSSAGARVATTSPRTQIRIHLPSGAISVDGPARWGSQ